MYNLMLETVTPALHPTYPERFQETVRRILPIHCYTPAAVEAFIADFEPLLFDGNSVVVEDAAGRQTLCRVNTGEGKTHHIDYIIPDQWEARHTMVKGALQQIVDRFLQNHSAHELRMRVNEQLPSHNAWYAGLLPELGFHLTPRVLMRAELSVLEQLTLPELPPGVAETAHCADQLEQAIELYKRAYDVGRSDLSAAELAREHAWEREYITKIYMLDGTVATWTGLTQNGQLIGFSCGGVWDDELAIEEVAIRPEFFGKGLGRYLTLRCMQKLYAQHGGPTTFFQLGTERTNVRALKLYHRLGFAVSKVESYVRLINPHFGKEGEA
ncbi:MAG: N-acetyltransferase [Caldilineaceae bacterium]